MKKLTARLMLLATLLVSAPAWGQVSPRAADIRCQRDDTPATVSEAEGQFTNVRCNPRGAPFFDLDTRLDPTNDAVAVGAVTATTNSLVTCYATSAASNNSTNCKGSAGNLYAISAINTTSTIYYLRLYNTASAPTCSSATGFVETIPVLVNTTPGNVRSLSVPQGFSTGISFCLTAGGGSTDNTNAATGVYLTLLYK